MVRTRSHGHGRRGEPRQGRRKANLLVCLAAYCAAALAAALVCRLTAALSPVWSAGLADIAATVVIFAFSLGLNNSSMYDPYWSVAPVLITLWWLARFGGVGGVSDLGGAEGAEGETVLRQVVVTVLVCAWAARLTWNWVRRWKGLSDEDWRYADYRRLGAGYWPMSFVGFHMMPTVLVFVGCLSLVPALSSDGTRATGILDVLAAIVTAAAIVVEAVADHQLRRFLSTKGKRSRILDTGLWAFSRHPNYFGEVLFWWGLWLFGLAADPSRWWTVLGPAGITVLFLGISVPMMDRRMLSRYPGYAAHMSQRSGFFPWIARKDET